MHVIFCRSFGVKPCSCRECETTAPLPEQLLIFELLLFFAFGSVHVLFQKYKESSSSLDSLTSSVPLGQLFKLFRPKCPNFDLMDKIKYT